MDLNKNPVSFFNDPFFWALISMFGLVGASVVVGGKNLGKYPLFGITVVLIFDLGRIILVLPMCNQPRFDISGWHLALGGLIFVLGLIFGIPSFSIKPFTTPDEHVELITTGFYGVVRNPIYLCEVLWCLGWAIMFRSIIGVALVPLWWLGLLFHTLLEEESLERELGQKYLDYKQQVRGRIIPGLPI
ncbi:MAG: methyltransferase family protein [Candidatus Kariarchaeaceae archaeon]|jgi:protein-S-isoprenylcysteine O-methyltransferase Ste14